MIARRLITLTLTTWVCGVAAACDRAPANAAEAALQEGEKKTSTDPAVNPDAAAMADFKSRVNLYVDLQRQLATDEAKLQKNTDPHTLNAVQKALAERMRAARASAKPGDVFTPQMRAVFRRLLTPKLVGEDGRDAKAVLEDDAPAPGTVPFKINARYPERQPMPSVPAHLLLTLPALPAPLEYRIVDRHLILLDTASDLIVDYMLNVIAI